MSDVNYCLLSLSLLIMTDNINTIVNEGCKDLDALDKEAEFNE